MNMQTITCEKKQNLLQYMYICTGNHKITFKIYLMYNHEVPYTTNSDIVTSIVITPENVRKNKLDD